MQPFAEYGDKLFASSDDCSSLNSSVLTNLGYCHLPSGDSGT
ncbi:hypothetical protein [Desulfosporosinus youngiae]